MNNRKADPIHNITIPVPNDPRIYKVQVKRDLFLFDQKVLGHEGEERLRIYQLAAAAPLIYIQRDKLQASLEKWMRDEGCYTEQEIQRWSQPVYEWPVDLYPQIRMTKEEIHVLDEWRSKYQIKDRTDWTRGILIPEVEKQKLDKYRQVAILQPRQSGKSEVVVRVNAYVITIVHGFQAAVFAPTEGQAKDFIFQRTRDYIEFHPAYKGRFKTLNALDMTFWGPDDEVVERRASGSSFVAQSASPGANIEGDSLDWAIVDESQDVTEYKIKKSIKYMMAAKKGSMIKIGTVNTVKGHFWESTTKKGAHFWYQVIIYPDIVAATRPDWAEFVGNAIEEDGRWSDTVRMSVFLEWLLDVGMFVTDDQWDLMVDPSLDWTEYDKDGLQFAVIDVAKSRDETICMVVKVDPSRVIDGRYPFRLLNCMALQGVDYVSQFHQIKSWLDKCYNVAAVGVDDTGGRGGIADQFLHTNYRVEAFTYTRPSKSEWYTNLSTIINAHTTAAKRGLTHELLIQIPGSKEAQRSKMFRDMEEQMLNLQKKYINRYMVVHHPEIEGAKDDYPDCLMMASWMASRVSVSVDELQDAMEQIQETTADKVDWSRDLFGSGQAAGPKKKKKQSQDQDDKLLQILQSADSLSGPDWEKG
jgi:hypothetical protein